VIPKQIGRKPGTIRDAPRGRRQCPCCARGPAPTVPAIPIVISSLVLTGTGRRRSWGILQTKLARGCSHTAISLATIVVVLARGVRVIGLLTKRSSSNGRRDSGRGIKIGVHNVAGEWGYAGPGAAGSSFPGGPAVTYGIGSSGYLTTGLAMDIGNFNNGAARTNLDDPASLDGINFGIISATVGPLNGGLSSTPLVQDLMTFTLTGNGNDLVGLDPSQLIKSVSFQYGTSFDETGSNVPGIPLPTVPEPQSLLLVALGLLALTGQRMLRKR
jgi:hypothetical protein